MSFDASEFRKLLESIRFLYGYDFTDYSEASMKRRVAHFIRGRKINSLEELGRILLRDEDTFEEFIQEVSVTVTEMFRDPSFYKSLRDKVIKRLATYPTIKIWIAGCATGEEVYSIAILLNEYDLLERSIIYATDINQKSLQIAKEGLYPIANMKTYTENYIKAGGKKSFSEYYKAKYDSVLFNKMLRQNVVLSPHNLTADKSFNEFQLIICRNVLIYFNQNLQDKVINLFYESLCPLGFLGLGGKESLLFASRRKYFEEIVKKERIYMKTE
ncbi:MAG: protein-glutamate O-methyltransferase CheR [Bacteroidetes bacterium]|nr:protein-glutamate O-methyltransferase CheR [Bacteroidota bacterium]